MPVTQLAGHDHVVRRRKDCGNSAPRSRFRGAQFPSWITSVCECRTGEHSHPAAVVLSHSGVGELARQIRGLEEFDDVHLVSEISLLRQRGTAGDS